MLTKTRTRTWNELGENPMVKAYERDRRVKGDPVRVEEEGFTPVKFEHRLIATRNGRNLNVALEVARKAAGDPAIIEVTSKSGRGKTTEAKAFVCNTGAIYLLCLDVWRRSELPMLQALCREFGMAQPPKRAAECFMAVADRLIANPRPVFLDEIDLLPRRINMIRQLAEVAGALFVLIGEETLRDQLMSAERVWSRTLQTVEFDPVSASDIIIYGSQTAGLEIGLEAGSIINRSPGGQDWRVVKRAVINLVEIANMRRSRAVTDEMAKQAIEMGLKGVSRMIKRGTA